MLILTTTKNGPSNLVGDDIQIPLVRPGLKIEELGPGPHVMTKQFVVMEAAS
jgi:hypothetical protein